MIKLHNKSLNNLGLTVNGNNLWFIDSTKRVNNVMTIDALEVQPDFLVLPFFNNKKPFVNLNGNFIIPKTNLVENSYTLSNKVISKLLLFKYLWNFKKIRYHGKGYKIRKSNKTCRLNFRFGKSHWTRVLFDNNIFNVRRTKKNTYTFLSIKSYNLVDLKKLIKKIKGVSHYTKRGVRLTRQYFKKRFGKVSQANSVYK